MPHLDKASIERLQIIYFSEIIRVNQIQRFKVMTLLQPRGREQEEGTRAVSHPSEEGSVVLRLLAILGPYPNLIPGNFFFF